MRNTGRESAVQNAQHKTQIAERQHAARTQDANASTRPNTTTVSEVQTGRASY